MKKLILKTALITLGVTLVLAVAVFGIMSISAPAVMMRFTESIGLESISGDYAWQEYELSGDYGCLARSFLVAAEHGEDVKANDRFGALYSDPEKFDEHCASQIVTGEGIPPYSYRNFVCGQAACVKYRLAGTDEKKSEAVQFAASETDLSFPEGNPLMMLAIEAAGREDGKTCGTILTLLREGTYEESAPYTATVRILGQYVSEGEV